MTANAMTALPISSELRLSGARSPSASSRSWRSPYSSNSGPYSSIATGSPSPAIEYASCGSPAGGSAAGANAVSSPVSPAAGASAVASPAARAAAGAAASAAPRASANVGSSGISTRMVDASRSWSATAVRSDDAPSRKRSPGASGWSPSLAIIVSSMAVASAPEPPASGSLASTVGGASVSPAAGPTTDSVAVPSSTTSTPPARPAARINAETACDSDSTATLCTPESSSACRNWSAC